MASTSTSSEFSHSIVVLLRDYKNKAIVTNFQSEAGGSHIDFTCRHFFRRHDRRIEFGVIVKRPKDFLYPRADRIPLECTLKVEWIRKPDNLSGCLELIGSTRPMFSVNEQSFDMRAEDWMDEKMYSDTQMKIIIHVDLTLLEGIYPMLDSPSAEIRKQQSQYLKSGNRGCWPLLRDREKEVNEIDFVENCELCKGNPNTEYSFELLEKAACSSIEVLPVSTKKASTHFSSDNYYYIVECIRLKDKVIVWIWRRKELNGENEDIFPLAATIRPLLRKENEESLWSGRAEKTTVKNALVNNTVAWEVDIEPSLLTHSLVMDLLVIVDEHQMASCVMENNFRQEGTEYHLRPPLLHLHLRSDGILSDVRKRLTKFHSPYAINRHNPSFIDLILITSTEYMTVTCANVQSLLWMAKSLCLQNDQKKCVNFLLNKNCTLHWIERFMIIDQWGRMSGEQLVRRMKDEVVMSELIDSGIHQKLRGETRIAIHIQSQSMAVKPSSPTETVVEEGRSRQEEGKRDGDITLTVLYEDIDWYMTTVVGRHSQLKMYRLLSIASERSGVHVNELEIKLEGEVIDNQCTVEQLNLHKDTSIYVCKKIG